MSIMKLKNNIFSYLVMAFPREMLPDSISMEQIKQAMNKCILSKKDDLFELLGVIISDDYLY